MSQEMSDTVENDTPETDALWDWSTCWEKAWPRVAMNMRDKARLLERERNEARANYPDGEWVSYADHEKVHQAASRFLVAINTRLPIGCYSLVSREYDALQSAIYGREGK
jgi:hypothetical protein